MSLEPERGGEDVVVGTVATTEEEVFLGSTLEHGVDVADLDDGLKRLASVAPLLGGRRGLVPLPDQHAAEALTVDRGPPSRRRNEVVGVAATPAWRGAEGGGGSPWRGCPRAPLEDAATVAMLRPCPLPRG